MHNNTAPVDEHVITLTCFHWTFIKCCLPVDTHHKGNCLGKSEQCAINPSLTLTLTYIFLFFTGLTPCMKRVDPLPNIYLFIYFVL